MDTLIIVAIIAGLAFSIILHEVAHGWVADRLGDPTARLSGRLTLNPIPHIDLVGTIIIPLLLFFSPAHFLFGWAKPVPIDPYNLQHPRKDLALVSLAGPLTNIVIAIILSLSARTVLAINPNPGGNFYNFYDSLIAMNIALAIFNLVPIHPLDGGKILVSILPNKQAKEFDYFMNKFGTILLFILIFPIFGGVSLASPILSPIINFFLNILIPGFSTI